MRSRLGPYLLVAPAAAVFVLLFAVPLAYFLALSFWQVAFYKLVPTFTLANYAQTLTRYPEVGLATMLVALATAALTTALGFVYAAVARFAAGRWGQPLLFLAMLTLFGGYLMKIYAWKTILGNEGLLNSALVSLGVVDRPIAALLYSPGAVVVTLVHLLLPFAILPIYGAMRGISPIELEAARDLGARPWRVVRDVLVPRCRAGVVGAFAATFLLAAGDYVTPTLVGGKMTMIGNLIAPQFGQWFNWPLGAAMSFVTLAMALAVLALANLLVPRGRG
jgi:spermidine/putrescine transport system permease protein